MAMLRRILWDFVCFVEVIVSVVVHGGFGIYMFIAAILIDLKNTLSTSPRKYSRISPESEAPVDEIANRGRTNFVAADSKAGDLNLGVAGAFLEGNEQAPIVLVHGIFGFGKEKLGTLSYWGGAESRDDHILVPDLGALSSIHDRACELFYYLKGGTVDYGVERSQKYCHSQFGHIYSQGHYPSWDKNHPIHFVAHSTGVQVVRLLQNMLAEKAFPGHYTTSEDWVLSVTALSGAMNGTTRVYLDGIRPEDGRSMKQFSLLQFLRFGALLYEWLDIPLFKQYWAFGFDHYNLQWHKAGITGLIDTFLNRTGPFATGNWVLPDLSIQSTIDFNKKLKTFDSTYYFSYATKGTKKVFSQILPRSFMGTHPLLFVRALQIALWCHPHELPAPYKGYRDEDWQDNDGALNTISQWYPRLPFEHPNCELVEDLKDGQDLRPGLWYYTTLNADHMYFVVTRDRAGVHFDALYDSIFQRCRKQIRSSSMASIIDSTYK